MTTSAALSGPSSIDAGAPSAVGTDDAARENASYASLLQTALFVGSQVDRLRAPDERAQVNCY